MVRLAAGEHRLKTSRGRFGSTSDSRVCQLCEGYFPETLEHVLWRCDHPQMKTVRDTVWRSLTDIMPQSMIVDLNLKDDLQKTVFLLSGLGGGYVQEWQILYVASARVVEKIYRTNLKVKLEMTD